MNASKQYWFHFERPPQSAPKGVASCQSHINSSYHIQSAEMQRSEMKDGLSRGWYLKLGRLYNILYVYTKSISTSVDRHEPYNEWWNLAIKPPAGTSKCVLNSEMVMLQRKNCPGRGSNPQPLNSKTGTLLTSSKS